VRVCVIGVSVCTCLLASAFVLCFLKTFAKKKAKNHFLGESVAILQSHVDFTPVMLLQTCTWLKLVDRYFRRSSTTGASKTRWLQYKLYLLSCSRSVRLLSIDTMTTQ
jgi:hypothetical protein